ncbi:MAG TPA: hypothetical protein VGR71_08235 [Nitrospira sp.]|nr:hypothetical protein [Nitrospira sp.]
MPDPRSLEVDNWYKSWTVAMAAILLLAILERWGALELLAYGGLLVGFGIWVNNPRKRFPLLPNVTAGDETHSRIEYEPRPLGWGFLVVGFVVCALGAIRLGE